MAKGTARGIAAKGLTQESLPYRIRLVKVDDNTSDMVYKGLLSTCPLTHVCFSEYDKPLESTLTIGKKTNKAIVTV